MKKNVLLICGILLGLSSSVYPEEVTVTNITKGVSFTPLLIVVSDQPLTVVTLGQVASEELAILAEAGDTGPLGDVLAEQGGTLLELSSGLLEPGKSVVFSTGGNKYLIIVSMLLPTNDGFLVVQGERVKKLGGELRVHAYDAGTEINSEMCGDIPGPHCGGEGFSPDPGEGYVYPHPGISGESELSSLTYNWHDPVALISVK